MNEKIEKFISCCEICGMYSNANVKEPLIPHPIPKLPFQKLGSDIFEFKSKIYLVCVDYYSKWIDYRPLKNKSAEEITKVWMDIFSNFGVPQIIICDNNPFNSFKCRKFAENWNFKIVNSSPLYPRSNGLAEKSVGILKNIFKKAKTEEDIKIALLEYRNTPTKNLDYSPAQLLMNRRLKTKLPLSTNLLKPKINKNAYKQLLSKAENNKRFYDEKTKLRNKFKVGQNVRINKNGVWKPAIITQECETPRSFVVRNEEGNEYRRNSFHLKSNKKSEDNLNSIIETNNNKQKIVLHPPSFTRSGSGMLELL